MAAYLSFWTSSMPKRLLRYVLYKLDYFETDALDLDKIDIAWGQDSHLTWQDVSVKIEACFDRFDASPSHRVAIQRANRDSANRSWRNY